MHDSAALNPADNRAASLRIRATIRKSAARRRIALIVLATARAVPSCRSVALQARRVRARAGRRNAESQSTKACRRFAALAFPMGDANEALRRANSDRDQHSAPGHQHYE